MHRLPRPVKPVAGRLSPVMTLCQLPTCFKWAVGLVAYAIPRIFTYVWGLIRSPILLRARCGRADGVVLSECMALYFRKLGRPKPTKRDALPGTRMRVLTR